MNQIHSSDVKVVNKETNIYTCDALVTNLKNTPLLVMVADCIPILFHDTKKDVIAVAHAGRNGTYLSIASKVIDKMNTQFACNAEDIKVTLGPSIQKCCYEVSKELALIAQKNFGAQFVENRNVDLQKINEEQLIKKGILKSNISISDVCTKCSNKDYFSYRKNSLCGRFAGLIMLTD